jgi:hypothetical protein
MLKQCTAKKDDDCDLLHKFFLHTILETNELIQNQWLRLWIRFIFN